MREPTTSQPTPPPREKGRRRCLAVTLLIFLGTLLTVVSVNPAVTDFFGDPPRRPSKVHCVCGPEEDHVNDRGCQVVVENGVTTVTAQTSIRFALFADSDLEFLRLNYSVYECLGFVGSVRPRLWWNWETTKLITARGTDADLKAAFHLDELPSDRTQLVPLDELLWAVSWIMAAHYHFTFQCGLYQAHLFQSLFPHQTGHPLPPIRVDLMSVSDWVQRHVTPAQRELFDTVVPSIGFSTHQNTTYASRFATFGFYWASPMTYRPDYKLFPGLKKTIPLFAASLQSRLIAKYGDVTRNESQVLFSNRPAGDGYDGQLRSRGIPAFFVTKLRATIETALPLITNYEAFDGRGSLQAQFHQVRRHRFVYGDEGSFFTSIILAPPRSTWVLVYNHSRSATDWKHCNFHATVASTLPFIKLVIFIIDKSQPEPPQEELLRVLQSPWHPGVVYIGADVNGNQLTMPPTRRPPPAKLARVQKVFYINDKSNHSAAAAP